MQTEAKTFMLIEKNDEGLCLLAANEVLLLGVERRDSNLLTDVLYVDWADDWEQADVQATWMTPAGQVRLATNAGDITGVVIADVALVRASDGLAISVRTFEDRMHAAGRRYAGILAE